MERDSFSSQPRGLLCCTLTFLLRLLHGDIAALDESLINLNY